VTDSKPVLPIWLPPFVSADSLTCKAGEMKLRLAVCRSSPGSSKPDTGGFSGFSTGAFWPKAGAGAGVVSGWDWELFWAAAQMLVPKTSSANRIFRILVMLFTRRSLMEPEYALRDNNCIPRLQYVVLFDLFPFDQLAIGHRQLLLFAVRGAQDINAFSVGKLV